MELKKTHDCELWWYMVIMNNDVGWSHMLHGAGKFTNISPKNHPNVERSEENNWLVVEPYPSEKW